MTLQPNFLPVGSIVEYNGMINDIVGIIPPKPDKSKRFNNAWVVELSIGVICPLSDIKPIKLTPEILTEWCGLIKVNRHNDKNMCAFCFGDLEVLISVDNCATFLNAFTDIQLDYLHELQFLFLGMKQVLPITIK